MKKGGRKWQKPKAKKEKKLKAKVKVMAAKKVEETPVAKETLRAPVTDESPRCACGKPIAPGQTFVCREHIRTN
jgi:hypothetical protein